MNTPTRWHQSELSILCDRIESLTYRVQTLHQTIEVLTDATSEITKHLGTRLTRAEVRNRLGVTNYTLNKMMTERRFPRPGADSKWLLTEVIEWEINTSRR